MVLARELELTARMGKPFCKLCSSHVRAFRANRRQLGRTLFDATDLGAFALIDGARFDGAQGWIEAEKLMAEPIFADDSDPELLAVSPWLVALPDRAAFEMVFTRAWGGQTGLFLQSSQSLASLRDHLRDLLYAKDSAGEISIFRFWDPRVLDRFLDIATADQGAKLYGGIVETLHIEGPQSELISRQPNLS